MGTDMENLTNGDSRDKEWAEKCREARHWFRVTELAERERRKREGEPLLQVEDAEGRRVA